MPYRVVATSSVVGVPVLVATSRVNVVGESGWEGFTQGDWSTRESTGPSGATVVAPARGAATAPNTTDTAANRQRANAAAPKDRAHLHDTVQR